MLGFSASLTRPLESPSVSHSIISNASTHLSLRQWQEWIQKEYRLSFYCDWTNELFFPDDDVVEWGEKSSKGTQSLSSSSFLPSIPRPPSHFCCDNGDSFVREDFLCEPQHQLNTHPITNTSKVSPIQIPNPIQSPDLCGWGVPKWVPDPGSRFSGTVHPGGQMRLRGGKRPAFSWQTSAFTTTGEITSSFSLLNHFRLNEVLNDGWRMCMTSVQKNTKTSEWLVKQSCELTYRQVQRQVAPKHEVSNPMPHPHSSVNPVYTLFRSTDSQPTQSTPWGFEKPV